MAAPSAPKPAPAHPYPPTPTHRPRAVPDLRFEHSYVRSIAPYVRVERPVPTSTFVDTKGKAREDADAVMAHEEISVQWKRLLWVTCRDQVLSPFVQGAVWYVLSLLYSTLFYGVAYAAWTDRGVVSHYLRPAMALFARWWQRGESPKGKGKDGGGVQWLKRWIGSLKSESAGTGARANIALH